MTQITNPLLQAFDLPPFSAIKPEQVVPAIDQLLADSRKQVAELLQRKDGFTWDNLVLPMDEMAAKLGQAWGPVSHLNAVCNNAELREAYEACLPKLSEFWTEMGQNRELFEAYKALANSPAASELNDAQRKVLDNELRDFHLSGIDLPPAQQARYGEIQKELSELSSTFSNQLLDATQAWTKHITDETALAGLPESALGQLAQAAAEKELDGWLVTLEFPSYYAIMTYADDRALREEVYTAYSTRASEQGPNAGEFDNTPVMQRTLELRQELAELLGFAHYNELSLATKMADSPQQVLDFLNDLAVRSKPYAEKDLAELQAFASEQGLFGIEISDEQDFERWHPDVRLFSIRENGQTVGRFYFDLYARSNKRGGAWMDGARDQFRNGKGELVLPVAYLVCNFTPAVGDKPALLTHDEVTTLFHEFGHGLHHMLTRIEQLGVSGINGVAWDAVELPSQFMENWCWEPEGLALIAGRWQTDAPLPAEMLERMLAARNIQSGMMMVRQLEFSLFDFELHGSQGQGRSVQQVLDDVRQRVAVMTPPAWNRFANSFGHIFAGGYAAGYYSYKWAEVLSADAFSRFEEEGVLNPQTGQAFRDSILAKGGAYEPLQLFVEFRGREPQIDALLRHSGLAA